MSKQIIVTVPDNYILKNIIWRIEHEFNDPQITVEYVCTPPQKEGTLD